MSAGTAWNRTNRFAASRPSFSDTAARPRSPSSAAARANWLQVWTSFICASLAFRRLAGGPAIRLPTPALFTRLYKQLTVDGVFALREIGRGERIRTSGLLVPNQALYQAEPRPERNQFTSSLHEHPPDWSAACFTIGARSVQAFQLVSKSGDAFAAVDAGKPLTFGRHAQHTMQDRVACGSGVDIPARRNPE